VPSLFANAAGAWAWSRRLVYSLVASLVLAALVGGVLWLLDVTVDNLRAALVTLTVASVVWLPFTRRWNARAHLCWAWSTLLFVAYLAFMLDWTIRSALGPVATAGALMLWVLELFAALLGCAYLWELCDALGSELWRRRVASPARGAEPGELPFVSLHVPAYNEPPDMVIETLMSLQRMDYDRFEIVVVDDNSDDESLWRPVEAWCAEHGIAFAHLEDWPGYKSGALNYALREMTDPRAELVGVIDSDYQIEPDFLRRCAPLFDDPGIGFIQAPQDYRGWQASRFYRRLFYSYKYFFAVSQPSRNERDGAIFAGTMGLIRRRALEDVGGWDEWCITEDAELSLRLLRRGWSGLHVDRSFGHGVMPLTFEGLKGQRFRWCFGGIQILRTSWRQLLPGPRTPQNRMTQGQRWAYLSGALQWYGDLLGLLFFLLLLGGAVNLLLGGDLLFRKLTGFLVGAIPLLMLIGLLRAVALLRRSTGASWREALGAFLVWQSTSLVVARASVQALWAREAEFLRTPKTAGDPRPWDAVRANWAETALALLGVAAMVATLRHGLDQAAIVVALLLVWPTVSFAAAPLNSLAAQTALLPPDLQRRRRAERARLARGVRRATATTGALVAVGGVAAVAIAALAPGPAPVSPPQLLAPAQGQQAPGDQAGPTTTPSPGTTAGTPGPLGGTPTATPSTGTGAPSPNPTPTSSPSPSSVPSSTPSATPTPTPTASGTPSGSPAASPSPTVP
jgi:cellulose synthase/poly-beta-1,6-N-acetylglucosamine synthase-like glycosyltransferase